MEDAHSVAVFNSDTPNASAAFGVYDGHCGRAVALFARRHLLNLIFEEERFARHG